MKQHSHSYQYLLLALIGAIVSTATAYAQVPAAPVDLVATQVSNGDMQFVMLTWSDPDEIEAGFRIFASEDAGVRWVTRTQRSESVNGEHREYTGPNRPGTHLFQVQRFNASGASEKSNLVSITLTPGTVVVTNIVQGTFADTAGTPLFGDVIGYRIDRNELQGQPVRGAVEFGTGRFSFTSLVPGDYVFWGFASDSVHVPGYHVADGIAATEWGNATRVRVYPGDTILGVDITQVFMDGHGGTARLVGTIVSESGSIRKQHDPRILGATPVEGVTVYAIDAASAVAGVAISNDQGRFEISGLPAGTYNVVTDMIGFGAIRSVVTVADGGEATADLSLGAATSSVATLPVASIVGIYPNPMTSSATIRFDALAGTTSLRLVDLAGREMLSRTITTVQGENSLQLETSGLAAGSYLLMLGEGSGSVVRTITIAR